MRGLKQKSNLRSLLNTARLGTVAQLRAIDAYQEPPTMYLATVLEDKTPSSSSQSLRILLFSTKPSPFLTDARQRSLGKQSSSPHHRQHKPHTMGLAKTSYAPAPCARRLDRHALVQVHKQRTI
ncbi:hypothetical protein J1614_006949 [Plenodomus biglobosus]|nr:hypothetical protein J1614_006949 [Plenodomus biglobosus]